MKSIKEKSEEYEETALKEKGAILRVDVRNAFKVGANYVLECIENALNKSFDELSIKDGYLEARKCIEQLKK